MTRAWYRSAVIYGIDVEKYADGNGDGIGDFVGLEHRLDYIAALGVTTVWLLPFYPSPRRDNGYDILDYFNVDPRFGTLQDFSRFVQAAGERGIRVIIELVMNHTSDKHPWFQASRRSRTSRYRDYYIWAEVPPPMGPRHGTVFPGEETSVWAYDEVAGAYYYHRFYNYQPNLDFTNREVRREMERVVDFWLSFGVAGFRIDAVPIMIGLDEPELRKPRDPHGLLKDLREQVERRRPNAALLGEADVEAEQVVRYFGSDEDELNMLFNFLLNNWLWLALSEQRKDPILRVLDQLPVAPPSGQWVNFLRNLDELNLGWLSQADRDRAFAILSPEPSTHLYGRGLRRRLAPLLGGDKRRVELAFSLLLTLPGTPMFVYGDEIGMGDRLDLPGRDACRGLMQWSAVENGGFSWAPTENLIRPPWPDGPYGYMQGVNVSDEECDPDSLLHVVRRLVRTRRECPEFALGGWHIFDTDSPAVFAQRSNWMDGTVIAAHNLSDEAHTVRLDLKDQEGRRVRSLLEPGEQTLGAEPLELMLPPYGYYWCRIVGERFGGGRQATNY